MPSRGPMDRCTDELTDTVQILAGAFPHIRADHRPSDQEWFRWLIYNDRTSAVVGVVGLEDDAVQSQNLSAAKVLLRVRALAIMHHAG